MVVKVDRRTEVPVGVEETVRVDEVVVDVEVVEGVLVRVEEDNVIINEFKTI